MIYDNDYLNERSDVLETAFCKHVDTFTFPNTLLGKFIAFLYLQLISDILVNRSQNSHIAPAINRLGSIQKDIDNLFCYENKKANIFQKNFTFTSEKQ